jgi:multiple sugar transport system ATP-binding protein
VSELTKIFDDGGDEILAVDNVSLEAEDGEFIVLVGPSGCGKTTTLRMIGGLETPTSGTIQFDGTTVNEVKARNRDVAMVFQDFALYPHMNVDENLGFGLRRENNDLSDEDIDNRVEEVAEMLEIEELLGKHPAELSGGQKQRVALGRAIVREPRVFLFDEPLANLDANLRKTMRTEIDALQSQVGITSLYVTHNQEEAMTMADRIAIMNDGVLQQLGAPEVVFNRPNNTFVARFIGSPNINLLSGDLEHADGTYTLKHDGLRIELDADALEHENVDSQSVTFGVRPQDLYEPTDTHEGLSFTGTITLIEPLGTDAIVQMDTEYGSIRAMMDNYQSLTRGDELTLAADLEAVYLFDEAGQLLKGREVSTDQRSEVRA